MSDSTGIWQFAIGTMPHRAYGYCSDDVARALIVDVLHGRVLGWIGVADSVERNLRFLAEAFDGETGRFRNMRAADGAWIGGSDSQDCHARALLGLGTLLGWRHDAKTRTEAAGLFFRALPAAQDLTAPRPVAAAVLACEEAMNGGFSVAQATHDALAVRLVSAFERFDEAWPWPENILTYENELPARALIAIGERLGDETALSRGRDVLDWLIRVQTAASGNFSPIGNRGWWPRDRERSQFDQQPIEAGSMVLAAADAYAATGIAKYRAAAESAYGWFLGDNDLGEVIADVSGGGCRDGLSPVGPNENQGAESTLMWLMALEAIRRMRAGT
jgi:hypothetical protein